MTVAVLSPHLDDAVLSCWSVLTSREEVVVITLFAGLPAPGAKLRGWDRVTGATDARRRMRERRKEDRQALALAARSPVHLDFLEQPYREHEPRVEELASAIAGHLPPSARIYAPAAIKGHPDHVLTRTTALALDSVTDIALYADLPYATRFGWPPRMTGEPASAHVDVDAFWSAELEGVRERFAASPSFTPLSGAQQADKLRAMRAYRTQFPGLDGGPQRRLSHPALLGFEAAWTARARPLEVPRHGGSVAVRWTR